MGTRSRGQRWQEREKERETEGEREGRQEGGRKGGVGREEERGRILSFEIALSKDNSQNISDVLLHP